jgi:hypothetical protein
MYINYRILFLFGKSGCYIHIDNFLLYNFQFVSQEQIKEKFLVNFHGFQADLSMEEDFFSCQQYERGTLPDFFQRFLHLKAQAPEV